MAAKITSTTEKDTPKAAAPAAETPAPEAPAAPPKAGHLVRVDFDVQALTRRLADHRKAQRERKPEEREATPGEVAFGDVPAGAAFLSGGRVYVKAASKTGEAWDVDASALAKFGPGSKHDPGPLCVVLPPLVLQPDRDRVGQVSPSWRNVFAAAN